MRIILKPAGAATILVAFFILTVLLFRHNSEGSVRAAVTPEAGASSAAAGANVVQNPGFEDGYQPVQPYADKATLSGLTAGVWRDDSSWAHVTADYTQDHSVFHSGASSQRIEVHEVQPTGAIANVVQYVQELKLNKGVRYTASIWARADRPTQVELALRQAKEPFASYGNRIVTINSTWQQIRMEGTVSQDGATFLMVHLFQPTRVWLDDAAVVQQGS